MSLRRNSAERSWLRLLSAGLCACLLLSVSSAASAADDASALAAVESLQQSFIRVIEQAEPTVVSIARDRIRPRGTDDFDGPRRGGGAREDRSLANPNYIPNDFGTGAIVRADGLILTNYHVVRGGAAFGKKTPAEQDLYVRLADRRGFPAQIYAADPRSDLAILKINAKNLPVVKLGNASDAKKGQLVITLGNPYAVARDGSASASWGIISNISRPAHMEGDQFDPDYRKKETIHHLGTLLQLDTRLNLGTSGSPVFNFRGEMIGLATSLAAISGYEKSAGFAIPMSEGTLRILQSLMRGEEVEYGFLGISPTDVNLDDEEIRPPKRQPQQVSAAKVFNVYPNSPAGLGGLSNGDIILGLNGRPVTSRSQLMREIALLAPGSETKLRVARQGSKELTDIDVILGKWPVHDDEGIVATNRRIPFWRGIAIDYNTARNRYLALQFRGASSFPRAVLITEVEPGSAGAASEVQAGDFITQINGHPVHSPRQFQEVVRTLTGDAQLILEGNRRVVVKAQP